MKGSLSVEVVLLFPLLFLILMTMLQVGFYLTYRVWEKSTADQGVLIYQDSLKAGDTPTQAVARTKTYLETKLSQAGLKDVSVTIEEKNAILYRTIHIRTEGRYSFLLSLPITATAIGEYRNARTVRDTMEVIAEAARRIPGFSDFIGQYQSTIAQWSEWLQ
jgi:hypothetical protein